MMRLFLLFICSISVIGCGSSNFATYTVSNRIGSIKTDTKVEAAANSLNENAYTSAGNSSIGRILKPLVGKTVNGNNLWKNYEIDRRLKKLMGVDYATMRKSWNKETPIKKFGDFLMMTGCEEKNCAANKYVIFTDTSRDIVNVVHISNGNMKVWWEDGEITLPPPFVDELSAMKSDR